MTDCLLWLLARARAGVAAYGRVLLVPVLLLVVWLVVGPYLLAGTVKVLSSPEGPWVAAMVVFLFVGVVLILRVVRALMRTGPEPARLFVVPKNLADSPVSRAVPKRLKVAWRILCRDYSTGYAEWVAARLHGEETVRQVLDFAAEHYGRWSDANTPGQLGVHRKARHEAAHAVVAHELGCTVTLVSLLAEGAWDGHTSFQMPVPRVSQADHHFILMKVLLAGRGTDLAGGVSDCGSGSDIERLVKHAAAIVSTGRRPDGHEGALTFDALVTSAASAVRGILAARAETVDEVADLVAEHWMVTGYFLRRILARGQVGAVPHT